MWLRVCLWIIVTTGCITALAQDKVKKAYQLYEEAEEAYNDDRYSEALVILDECLKHYPGYFEAYSLRGSVREVLKDNDGALTDYSIYLDRFPEHLPVLMSRAILRYKMGFYDQAHEDFIKLLGMNPSETNTIFYRQNATVGDRNPVMTPESGHKSYIYNYLGLTEAKRRDHRTAIAYYVSASLRSSQAPCLFFNLALAIARLYTAGA